jgi:cryptochrome
MIHEALSNPCVNVVPIFCLDPAFVEQTVMKVGNTRWKHLLETLEDLDKNLAKLHSRLLVVRGDPKIVLPNLIKEFGIDKVYYENDTEPYAVARDTHLNKQHPGMFVGVNGHTLYEAQDVIKAASKKTVDQGGKAPLTYRAFQSAIEKLPKPADPLPNPSTMPPLPKIDLAKYSVPTMQELKLEETINVHVGGETEALNRLAKWMEQKDRVAKFEKPETNPAMIWPDADTTVLSPYLKFGSLSCRTMYHQILQIYSKQKHTDPPTSLLGQLLWREFYYVIAATTPEYHSMQGSSVSLQVDWHLSGAMYSPPSTHTKSSPGAIEHLERWKKGQTGFPWIDAIMRQLQKEGWIHHLARHCVACFLTRGDCYISWERGAEVFEELLLDADPALNIGNWLWLSSSAFFTQYFRVYSPVAFPGKYKPASLAYIRKYVTELKEMPDKFLFEPWNAPKADQQKVGLGTLYPLPMLNHSEAMKLCIDGLKQAYAKKQHGKPGRTESLKRPLDQDEKVAKKGKLH